MLMTNNVKQEWQVISDDELWETIHAVDNQVNSEANTRRLQWTPKQWTLLGAISLTFVSVVIYFLWRQAKQEIVLNQIDSQAMTTQKQDIQQTEVVVLVPRQTLDTEHFRFYFTQGDTSSVKEVGPRIEDFYRVLRRDFALPQYSEPIIVEVQQKSVVGSRLHLDNGRWIVTIPSPASLLLPMNFSTADAIFLFLASALTDQVIEELQQSTRVRWEWRQMPEVFRRWYVIRHDADLAGWHDEMTVWLVTQNEPSTADTMPPALRRTCQNFSQATLSIAWHGAIPLQSCMTATQGNKELTIPQLPGSLAALSSANDDWSESTYRIRSWIRLKATETVIDYVVSQHGPEQIGPLFRGFMQYDSWAELVPAIFNISVTEFEAGWQDHVEGFVQLSEFSVCKNSKPSVSICGNPCSNSIADNAYRLAKSQDTCVL